MVQRVFINFIRGDHGFAHRPGFGRQTAFAVAVIDYFSIPIEIAQQQLSAPRQLRHQLPQLRVPLFAESAEPGIGFRQLYFSAGFERTGRNLIGQRGYQVLLPAQQFGSRLGRCRVSCSRAQFAAKPRQALARGRIGGFGAKAVHQKIEICDQVAGILLQVIILLRGRLRMATV